MSTSSITDLKILATGLGAGILTDAVIIRCLLVPAMVALFGQANWWLPEPLRRLLRIPASPATPPTSPSLNSPRHGSYHPTTGLGIPPPGQHAADAAEFPQFLASWLASDPARLAASLLAFVGHPAYRGQLKANPPEQYRELSASARYAVALQAAAYLAKLAGEVSA